MFGLGEDRSSFRFEMAMDRQKRRIADKVLNVCGTDRQRTETALKGAKVVDIHPRFTIGDVYHKWGPQNMSDVTLGSTIVHSKKSGRFISTDRLF
jgi:hypothetical protein